MTAQIRLAVVLLALSLPSLSSLPVGTIKCQDVFRTVITKVGKHNHCLCPAETPLCRGSHCSTGHEHCNDPATIDKCRVVHGYETSCTDCHCVPDDDKHLRQPQQLFTSMTGIEGEISVNFVIQGQHSKPSVHYGHTAADLDHVADAVERIDHDYDRLHYTIWTAIITAPALDLVFYRAFNGGDGTMLHRLRVPSSRAHNATLAICGDIGLKWSAPIVSEALKHDNTLDLMIQPGDISYATTIEGMNTFLDRMQSLASRVPYLTMLGNHESDRKEVLTAYQARFPNDILAQNSHAPDGRYYSFDAYGIHFAILDSMQNLGSSSAQYQWLEKDLMAAAERRRVDPKAFPWIIVSYHYPMYSSHNRKGDTGKQAQLKCMQESLEALFMLYKVDIAITGHDHVYERSVPLYQGKQNAEGIVHLTVGTGGHNIYSSWDPQPAYTAYRLTEPGYGRLSVLPDGSLHWEFIEVDISPCKRMTLGGDLNCPTMVVQKSQGEYVPRVTLRDEAFYSPRTVGSASG